MSELLLISFMHAFLDREVMKNEVARLCVWSVVYFNMITYSDHELHKFILKINIQS